MSQENVEIVRRAYEVLSVVDYDRSRGRDFFASDVEVDLSRNVFNPLVFRGYDGLDDVNRMVNEAWDDFSFEPEELIDAGEQVVAVVKLSGKGKGSGVPVAQQDVHVITLRDGKCVRIRVYHDRAEALEAVGLSE